MGNFWDFFGTFLGLFWDWGGKKLVVLLNYKKKCENLLINDKLFMQKTSFCSKKIKKKFFKSSNTTIFVRALFYWC